MTGCGAGAQPRAVTGASESDAAAAGPFPALRPAPPPAGWRSAMLPSGAVLAYPADWRPIRGDSGTASAALRDAHGRFLGYLNLTPRQGGETFANWPAFRLRHIRAEGDLVATEQGSARGVPFRDGARGVCVRDAYTTSRHLRFVEVACLVHGRRADSVIVAAAPPRQWARRWPTLRRVLEAVRS
ncbi:MAG TPA: hypothetical protein VFU94_01165 [Conexibacter sp.]|nr:hypothetical protein [Conexibacter sp.]